jgi:hypothetical protein
MRMHWLTQSIRRGLLTFSLVASLAGGSATLFGAENLATHKQVRTIEPRYQGVPVHLNTFCLGPDQNLYLCCKGNDNAGSDPATGVILVYTGEGILVREIPVSFVPQAINFSSAGSLFLAGSGKVARLSPEGVVEIEKDAPNIGNKEEMLKELKQSAEKQQKAFTDTYSKQLDTIKSQIEALEEDAKNLDPDDEKGTARIERRLRLLTQQRDQWQSIVDQIGQSFAVPNDENAFRQVMRSTGLAVSKQDVFVSLPKTIGYGYSIYRMNHDLEEATVVKGDVGGCCGQLDIQSDGENLLIAENTSFTVGIYDRDGTKLTSWGKRGRAEPDGFGSCCNPMNVRCCSNGEILTAESSIGDIKRFSKKGEFLGIVGRASVAGGCKHVAIGWDNERNWHYMMNQDKSSVAVLVPKEQAPEETSEERSSRIAMEKLGHKLVGTWVIAPKEKKKVTSSENGSFANYDIVDGGYGHLEFAADGAMIHRASTSPRAQPQSSGVLGAIAEGVAKAIGGDSEGSLTEADSSRSTWKAVVHRDGQLEVITYDDGVQYYGALVKWISDEEIELKWFEGAPEQSIARPTRYRLVSKSACGQSCTTEKGAETKPEAATTEKRLQASNGEGQ